jgi:heat shock protein 5
MKGQLSDSEGLGGKLESSDKKELEAELKKAQDWLDEYSASASVEDFDEQREALQAAVAPITSKIVSSFSPFHTPCEDADPMFRLL